jgi:light-regulated signal transduction histidine kinase (bacteriophytochrome)
MVDIFGVDPGNDRSKYVSAIHPDDLPVRNKAYKKAFEDGVLEFEARVLKKNNVTTWIRAKGRVLFDEEDKPVKLVTVIQDITKEKNFAEELTRQVKERTQELEEFTFVSHHDLQEPLRKIIMFTDMVRFDSQNVFSQASKSRLEKVTSSARRMSTALRDVLNFASLDKKEGFVATDLDEVLAAVQNDLELVILEKKANFQSEQLPVIYAVQQQMHQLFYNLVNNALKFSRTDVLPLIAITCKRLTDNEIFLHPDLKPNHTYFHITFTDNGIGFDQSSSEKIFVLFQRLHSKESYAGTGIGLALCKKVVQNHEGKIWATSEKEKGATFNIILPEALKTF